MAVTTPTIYGGFSLPDGVAVASAKVSFKLSGMDTQNSIVLIPFCVKTYDLIDGQLPVGAVLWRNSEGLRNTFYTVTLTVTDTNGNETVYNVGKIQITGTADSYDITLLLQASASIVSGDQFNILTDAELLAITTALAADLAAAQDAAMRAGLDAAAAEANRILAETASANAQDVSRQFATWSLLQAATGTVADEAAGVLDTDTGNHLAAFATGYDGIVTPNAGTYSWNATWSRWVRINSTGLSGKASVAEVAVQGSQIRRIEGKTDPLEVGMLTGAIGGELARAVVDPDGNAIETLGTDGVHRVTVSAPNTLQIAEQETTAKASGYAMELRSGSGTGPLAGFLDWLGRIFVGRLDAQALTVQGVRVATLDDLDALGGASIPWAATEAEAIAWREAVRATPISGLQYPTAVYNHFAGFGQSLSYGYESWPALSVNARTGVYTVGDSAQASGANAFTPITTVGGSPVRFRPAVARVLDAGSTDYLDNMAIAALTYGDTNSGEPPVLGAVNAFAARYCDQWQTEEPRLNFVVTESANGGQSISVLNSTRFERLGQAIDVAFSEAGEVSASYALPAITYIQGNADYSGAMAEATWITEWADLCDLIDARVLATAGQAKPPVKFVTQCVATSVTDVNNQAVGMAQWRVAQGRNDTVLVGPDYAWPDKGIHLTANASRWCGEQIAKVMDIVFNRREGWEHLCPYRVWADPDDATVIYAVFSVPAPPLQWRDYYTAHTATMRDDRGFRVTDALGTIPFADTPEIVGPCTLRFTLTRAVGASPRLRYAGEWTGGGGNLFDSDPVVSVTKYEFVTYMNALENVAALVNKPYPLNNACGGFDVAVPFTRADLAI